MNASNLRCHLLTGSLAVVAAVLGVSGSRIAFGETVTIIANPGGFQDVGRAAGAESEVNWNDKDVQDDTACTECFAAAELREFIARTTRIATSDIRLAMLDRIPDEGHVFLLGSNGSNRLIASIEDSAGSPARPTAPESYRIRAFERGGRTITIIQGRDRVGTLYGTYAYVTRLGVRFYGLGENGTVYPPEKAKIPTSLDLLEGPHYVTRGFWPWLVNADRDFYLWMARNRLNLWTPEEGKVPFMRKLGLKLIQGGHIVQYACLNPKAEYPYNHARFGKDDQKEKDPYAVSSEYAGDTDKDGRLSIFEAHPEWYGLQKGKRSGRITTDFGDNYCTSNKDATAELAKNLIRELTTGQWRDVDILNFWMLDNGTYCECASCKKQGTCTDRLFAVLHAVRQSMTKAQAEGRLARTVKLSPEAYHETLPPPSAPLPADFDYDNCLLALYPIERTYAYAFADPRSTQVNRHLLERYRQWTSGDSRTYRGAVLIGEYYNVSSFASLPLVFTRIMAADIPWYYRNGTRHFNYMHTPLRLWGTWALNQHLMAELLWNVDVDVKRIHDEYFRGYYPTSTKHARTLYECLETASSNMKPFKHYAWGYSLRGRLGVAFRDKNQKLFIRDDLQYFPHHPQTDDGVDVVEIVEAMRGARQAVDDAMLVCTDARERLRLIEDERRFAYGEAMVFFYYHMIRTVTFHQQGNEGLAAREFTHVEEMAERLRQTKDLVNSAGEHSNFEDGLKASQIQDVYKAVKAKYMPSTKP